MRALVIPKPAAKYRPRSPRAKHLMLVTYRVVEEGDPPRVSVAQRGYGEDISASGVCLRVPALVVPAAMEADPPLAISASTVLEMEFSVGSRHLMRCGGTVTWNMALDSRPGFLVGVAFSDVSDEQRQRIQEVVSAKVGSLDM